MDKIKLNTAEGQAAIKAVPLGTQIVLHGEIVMGKYMTKALAGEDLKKDCDFMMSRGVRQPNRNERYRFNITNVQLITEGRQTLNAAEQYVWQSVYADKDGRPTKVVEMGNKEFIDNKISWGGTIFGYKGADGIYPCNIMGQNIANGQGVTVTYSVYAQKNGDYSVGFDYVVFDAEPQFYVPQATAIPQGWVQAPIKTYEAPASVETPVAPAMAPTPAVAPAPTVAPQVGIAPTVQQPAPAPGFTPAPQVNAASAWD